MLKIVLLVLLLNSETDEVKGVVVPVPVFETMDQCHDAVMALPDAPIGYKLKSYCIDPKAIYM